MKARPDKNASAPYTKLWRNLSADQTSRGGSSVPGIDEEIKISNAQTNGGIMYLNDNDCDELPGSAMVFDLERLPQSDLKCERNDLLCSRFGDRTDLLGIHVPYFEFSDID